MSFLIYLDQNTLSDLRQRKMEETNNEHFKLLKLALKSEKLQLVYSNVTLEEILNISKREYQDEHIELLAQLNAAYIESPTLSLNKENPRDIWNRFL